MQFGEYLRNRREELGYSQREIAEFLSRHGYPSSKARISHWETGHRAPPDLSEHRFRSVLATALETDTEQMLAALDYVIPAADLPTLARQAAEIVMRLPLQRQVIAVRILKALSEP